MSNSLPPTVAECVAEITALNEQMKTAKEARKQHHALVESPAYRKRMVEASTEFALLVSGPDLRGTGIPECDGQEKERRVREHINKKYGVDLDEVERKKLDRAARVVAARLTALHDHVRILKAKVNGKGTYDRRAAGRIACDASDSDEASNCPEDVNAVTDTFAMFCGACIEDAFKAETDWMGGKHKEQDVVAIITEQMSHVKDEATRLAASCPQDGVEIAEIMNTTHLTLSKIMRRCDDGANAEREAVRDSWEELVDSPLEPENETTAKQLLGRTAVAFPELGSAQFAIDQGHPQLLASRTAAAYVLYSSAAKKARRHYEIQKAAHPGVELKPVVFDYGAGSFGAERIQMLKTGKGSKNGPLYLHASIPEVDYADKARLDKLREQRRFPAYNYVPETRIVVRDRLNYCHHLARDCDCMKYYTEGLRFPVAVHAAYYFQQRDYDKILSYAPILEAAVHIPRPGHTIPLDKPEYVWDDPRVIGPDGKPASVVDRVKFAFKEFISGVPSVRMRPIRTGGTVYEHEDIGHYIVAGGFHSYPTNAVLDDYVSSTRSTLAGGATVFASAAVAAFIGAAFSSPVVALTTAAVAGINAVCMAAACAAVNKRRRFWRSPCPDATATIQFYVKNQLKLENAEPLVSILSVNKVRPTKLIPQCCESEQVDPTHLGRATSSVCLAGDSVKTRFQVAARMSLEGLPLKKIRDTVSHAVRCVNFLGWGQEPPPRPPSSVQLLCAGLSLPYACAASRAAKSTLLAASPTTLQRFAVRALYLGSALTFGDLISLVIFFLPIHYAITLTLAALLGLVL